MIDAAGVAFSAELLQTVGCPRVSQNIGNLVWPGTWEPLLCRPVSLPQPGEWAPHSGPTDTAYDKLWKQVPDLPCFGKSQNMTQVNY